MRTDVCQLFLDPSTCGHDGALVSLFYTGDPGIRQKARRAGSGVIWGAGSVSFPFWPWNICFQPSCVADSHFHRSRPIFLKIVLGLKEKNSYNICFPLPRSEFQLCYSLGTCWAPQVTRVTSQLHLSFCQNSAFISPVKRLLWAFKKP